MKFSKDIVVMVIILNISFTAAVLYTFLKVGSEPMTMIGCWFAFTTGELWLLAGIKKKKIDKENEREDKNKWKKKENTGF